MPNKLRSLSGSEVISFCARYDILIISTKGSHVNLGRFKPGYKSFVTTVPLHKQLDRGTSHGIFKRLLQFIPEQELREFFYTGNR